MYTKDRTKKILEWMIGNNNIGGLFVLFKLPLQFNCF
ncbi:UNVERIFIED_CONTAM: hypothetical protein Cloal_4258 [Acetivibrio alkalicellulosi]